MTVCHGGDWTVQYPYDSLPAFERANEKSADAVKGDFRVSKDNIGMVMHSSPIEIYESLDCFNKSVEEMTAAENSQCHMINTEYTFISVPDALAWANGTINFMFCVKESADIPRAISTLIEEQATHRAFLEINVDEMLHVAMSTEKWEEVYYVILLSNADEMQRMLAASTSALKRTFLFEFKNWSEWDDLSYYVSLAHSHGIRTFAATNDNSLTATVQNHRDIFAAGIDVVYTYNIDNAVVARMEVNEERGISPP